jgi:D-amino-acid dehydrogenase
VIASGAWSGRLAAQLGDRIPLEAERGYNTTLPADAFDLKRQLVLPADGYVITPLATGIRVGGAAEFAGLQTPSGLSPLGHDAEKAESVMHRAENQPAAHNGWVFGHRCLTPFQ